jgi:hypothetical protein
MKVDVRSDAKNLPDRPLSPEQNFLKRRRRYHLASDRPLGIERHQVVRRPGHP